MPACIPIFTPSATLIPFILKREKKKQKERGIKLSYCFNKLNKLYCLELLQIVRRKRKEKSYSTYFYVYLNSLTAKVTM